MRRLAITGARSSRVSTACTPGSASAASFETLRIAACGCGLRTKPACSMSGTTMSSMKRRSPRSSGGSSTRLTRAPISEAMNFYLAIAWLAFSITSLGVA